MTGSYTRDILGEIQVSGEGTAVPLGMRYLTTAWYAAGLPEPRRDGMIDLIQRAEEGRHGGD